MKTKILSLILFCCLTQFLKAQDKGTVIFNVAPLHAQIKINNQILKPADIGESKTSIQLNPGEYKVQIWAFGMGLYEEVITIESGKTTMVTKALKPTESYILYQESLLDYYDKRSAVLKKQQFLVGTASVVTASTLTYSTLSVIRLTQLNKQMKTNEIVYKSSIDGGIVQSARVNYNKAQVEFNERRKNYYTIGAIGTGLSVGLWYYTSKKVKQTMKDFEKPIFDDSNPLSSVKFDLDIEKSDVANNYPAFSIIYQF